MFKLKYTPYNRIRIDCYLNNIIGILMTQDPAFERMVPLIASRYEMFIPDPDKIGEDKCQEMMEKGWTIPYVHREFPEKLFQEYVDQYEVPADRDTDVIEQIKQQLHDGAYCMISLNRYHFPECPECQKQNLVHPVLVIGYDDARSVVYIMEDCKPPGRLLEMEVRYEDIRLSYSTVPDDRLLVLGLRPKQPKMSQEVPFETITSNLAAQLNAETVEIEQGQLVKGIDVLDCYRNRYATAALGVRVQDFNVHNRLSTPLYYLERNQLLIDDLSVSGVLSGAEGEQLKDMLAALHGQWSLIRLKTVQYYNRDERPDPELYAEQVAMYLDGVRQEREWLNQLLERLHSAMKL